MNRVKNRYRYSKILLKQLVKTDFKLRYQGSILGYVWSLLKPLFLFGILYVVFVVIAKINFGVEHSGLYLLLGIITWSFFAELTGGSVRAIVDKGELMRKINFPRYTIILATSFSALINLLLNLLVFTVFMIFSGVSLSLSVLFVPLLFVELMVFSVAIGFLLSTSYVKFRDVGHIWDVVTQALFYLTPILFPITFAPAWAQKILMLNPLAQIIQDLRYILVSNSTPTINVVFGDNPIIRLVPISIVILCVFVFSNYFKRRSRFFAEEV